MNTESIIKRIRKANMYGHTVHAVCVENKIIGFISENNDWNKYKRPVSVKSPNGESIGDFCCIHCAIDHLVEKESVAMLNTETHPVPPLELFLRRMLREILAEKSPR